MLSQYEQDNQDISLMAVDQYLRFVHWTPSMSDEEEALLFERIWRGKAEQEQPCPNVRILEDAREARDRLVEGYQGLVLYIALAARRRFRSLELLDLIQEGNLELLRAIDSCRPGRGHFTGLASAAIRGAIWTAQYETDRTVRVSQKARVALSKLTKAERRLKVALEREPTPAELAKALRVSEDKIQKLLIWRQRREVESLQGLLIDEEAEDKYAFVNLFESAKGNQEGNSELLERVRQAVETLTPDLQAVVRLRYGFDEEIEQAHTCTAIAERLGVSFSLAARRDRIAKKRLYEVLAPFIEGRGTELAG